METVMATPKVTARAAEHRRRLPLRHLAAEAVVGVEGRTAQPE